jgi:U3 small nucleolar ribonucleoprotein protein IMP4
MSGRRLARQRREYLYARSANTDASAKGAKLAALKGALDAGRSIPTELRGEESELRDELETYDAAGAPGAYGGGADAAAAASGRGEDRGTAARALDDEYSATLDGRRPPKLAVTTSRDPSSRLKRFVKEMSLVLPDSNRVNRGNHRVSDVLEAARAGGCTDLLVFNETRGRPDGLAICHLPLGPTAYFTLEEVVLRHDVPKDDRPPVSEQQPHLVTHGFGETPIGRRMETVLRCLFGPPKETADTKRVITMANDADVISFRHHLFETKRPKPKKTSDVSLVEIGPRFEMRPYMVRLGTLDMPEAEVEWNLRPFMRSAKRAKLS